MSDFTKLTTKAARVGYIRHKLATEASWALRGLVRIYENQTLDEQTSEDTRHDNGIGFTSADGHFMTSMAKQYIARGSLSEKQMKRVFKNMPKYARQLEKEASR